MAELNLKKSQKALRAARAHLTTMQGAKNFAALEDAWRAGLSALEQCWNAAEHSVKLTKTPAVAEWIKEYRDIRRTDEMVCYLHHARNSEDHSIRDSVMWIPGRISIGIAAGQRPLSLTEEQRRFFGLGPNSHAYALPDMQIDGNGRISYFHGDPRAVQRVPERLETLPVIDRGVAYPVPRTHLGIALPTAHPVQLLDLGIRFYEELVRNLGTAYMTGRVPEKP